MKCQEKVFDGWHSSQCTNDAKEVVNGVSLCGIHARIARHHAGIVSSNAEKMYFSCGVDLLAEVMVVKTSKTITVEKKKSLIGNEWNIDRRYDIDSKYFFASIRDALANMLNEQRVKLERLGKQYQDTTIAIAATEKLLSKDDPESYLESLAPED
jgi:hypothetical protein